MSSTINTSKLRTYKKDNNELIIPGAMLNSAIVSNEGADGFYSVFAHQINWSYTTFGNIDISTKPGTTYTEKLLNTIESYICSYVSSTGVTNNPVIGTNGDKTYINVNGKKSSEIYISYATTTSYLKNNPSIASNVANGEIVITVGGKTSNYFTVPYSTRSSYSELAWNTYQFKNLTGVEGPIGSLTNYKCELLFTYHYAGDNYYPTYFDNRLMFDCITGYLEGNFKGTLNGTSYTAVNLSNASLLTNSLTDNTISAYIGGKWSNNLTIAYATTASYLTSHPVLNITTHTQNSVKLNVTVGGKTSGNAYIEFPSSVAYAHTAGTATNADIAAQINQYINTSKSGKSELLFATHGTGSTDPIQTTTYYDKSIYVDHSNGNKLVSYGFRVAQANGSIYSNAYVVMADGSVLKQADIRVGSAINATNATNSTYATKLANSRTISLVGAVTGSISFDGSSNASMSTTINKNALIGNNIELNMDKSLKNYGGFIDFHYVNSAGQFVYKGAYIPSPTDYSSRIIEIEEGKLSVNGVQCVYSGIAYANAFYQTSDINYKNIVSYDCNLSVTDIANAPIIKFTWKESPDNSYQIGTIAQYWQTYLPESIGENEKLSFNYSVVGTISGIVNARKIVELEKENKELKQENKELKQEIKELKEKMDKILQYLNI